MNVVGYVRVSTGLQADSGLSLAAQRAKIRAYAELQGASSLKVFADAGVSGTKTNRPGLSQALDLVCKQKGVLVVYSLSRLARSVRQTLEIAERLDKAGADLASLSEALSTASASGKMLFRMLAVLGEFERDLTAERTSAALQQLRAEGRRFSRHPPYGWDFSPTGKLVKNSREQTVIRYMSARRSAGDSWAKLADRLSDREIPTKTSKGRWHARVVQRILERSTDPR